MEERFLVLRVICSHWFVFYCSHWFHVLRTIHETLRTVFLNNIFFLASHFKRNVWKKSLYHGMNIENINDWGECHCSCSFVASGQKCLISYLKDISGLTHLRFVLFFFVPWFHYRIKGKNNSIFILESYSHLSESFSVFC